MNFFQTFLFVQHHLNVLPISLLQNPSKMNKAQAEVDLVLGTERPTYESLKKLQWVPISYSPLYSLQPV